MRKKVGSYVQGFEKKKALSNVTKKNPIKMRIKP